MIQENFCSNLPQIEGKWASLAQGYWSRKVDKSRIDPSILPGLKGLFVRSLAR